MSLKPFTAWDDDMPKPETRPDLPPHAVTALRQFYAMHTDLEGEGWVWEAPNSDDPEQDLSAEEWKKIAGERQRYLTHCNHQLRDLLESLKLLRPRVDLDRLREGYLSALSDRLRCALTGDGAGADEAGDRLELYAGAYDREAAALGAPDLQTAIRQDGPDDCEEIPF